MGYFDEDQNDSILNDISKVKGTYDNAKGAVDTAKQVKSMMDSAKTASDASKAVHTAKTATDTAKAVKTGAEVAKTASTAAGGAKAAATAAKVATGAASGPVGWAALAASLLTSEKGRKLLWLAIALPIIFLIIIFIVILSPLIIVYEKAGEIYEDGKAQLALYDNYYSVGTVEFNDDTEFWSHIYETYKIKPDTVINSQTALYSAEAEMNFNICKEIIDNAIDWSFKAPRDGNNGGYWTMFVKSDTWLGKFFESTWDWLVHDNAGNASYDSFMDAQYPYTLGETEIVTLKSGALGKHTYYTIKNYMDGEIPDGSDGNERKLNNDLNYAEIINAVSLGMSPDGFTFREFYEKLMDPKVRRNFAELSFKEYYYIGKDTANGAPSLEKLAEKLGYGDDVSALKKNRSDVSGYLKYDVYPYGLEELFDIAGVKADEASFVAPPVTNLHMLDEYENIYRRNLAYLNLDMGIGFQEERSSLSKAYSNFEGKIGTTTGRSAYSYVDKTSILYGDLMWLEEWDSENTIYDTIIYVPTGKSKILDFNYDPNAGKTEWLWEPQFKTENNEPAKTHSFYICQKDYPGAYRGPRDDNSTIYNEGCTDSCYTMSAQYLLNRDISIRAVSKAFTVNKMFQSGGTFNPDGSRTNGAHSSHATMLDYFGLYSIRHDTTFDETSVINAIDAGQPCIFVVYGAWKYKGVTYHSDTKDKDGNTVKTTHFITIIGYDDYNFYVLDPAIRYRTKIPREAFRVGNIQSWRFVGDTTNNNGTYFTHVKGARFAYSDNGIDNPWMKDYKDIGNNDIPSYDVDTILESMTSNP